MNQKHFEARRAKLRALLHKADLSALLVTLDANRFYLSGFELHDPQINESAGCLVINKYGRDWLCTDSRYLDAAKRLWDEDRILIYKGSAMEHINGLLRKHVAGPIGFEARNLSVDAFKTLSPDLNLQPADGMVESLRRIKEPAEIGRLERSCTLNHKLMEWLPAILTPGRSEAEIAWEIEQFFRNNGAEELSFSCIVAVGANAALPHAEPGPERIKENCCVLVDVGCRMGCYCSDQTRTFWVGDTPDPLFTEDLALVREAQAKAIAAIRPGVPMAEVYQAARAHFEAHGVAELFTHGLGHGIGLQTHESPSVNPSNTNVLQEGMVITVEPGLYRPGKSGVRWEYMVLVTANGARVL